MEKIEELKIEMEKAHRAIKKLKKINDSMEHFKARRMENLLNKIKGLNGRFIKELDKSIEDMKGEMIIAERDYEFMLFCKKYSII